MVGINLYNNIVHYI